MTFVTKNATIEQKSSIKTSVTVPQYTQVSTNGSLQLDGSSASVQFLTGTASGFSVILPNATTLSVGTNFEIYNRSTNAVSVRYFDGSLLGVTAPESVSSLVLQDGSTQKGVFSPFTVEIAQAAGITNYNSTSTSPFSTSSTTDAVITDFVVTPQAGTYAIFFNASNTSTNQNSLNYITLYKGNTPIAGTERVAKAVGNNFEFQLSSLGIATFTGAEELRVYVRVTSGTITVNARTGVALRLGP